MFKRSVRPSRAMLDCVSTDSHGEMNVLYLVRDVWSYELVHILARKVVFLLSHVTVNAFSMHQSTTRKTAKTNLVVVFTGFLQKENRRGKLNHLSEPRVIEWSTALWRVEIRLATAAWREVLEYVHNQS
jgi:hypothetical protein